MSKRTLSAVVGSIQSSKSKITQPRIVQKEQAFTPPKLPGDQNSPPDQKRTTPSDEKVAQGEIIPQDRNLSSGPELPTEAYFPQMKNAPYPQPKPTPEQKLALTLERLKKGFTRIPNSILIEILYGDLSKAEIKIVLLIARFTLSFQERRTASLSKADIERYTRLQGKSVLEALSSLVDKKLILKIKGDQYSANQLGLIFDPETFLPSKGPSSGATSGEDQKITHLPIQKGTSPGETKRPYPADQKSTHFKDSFSNELSLSEEFPSDMVDRWRNFMKIGKSVNAKREIKLFRELHSGHGEPFFENCGRVVQFLERYGTGRDGEESAIHSPMDWINGHWETNLQRYRKFSEDTALAKQKEVQKRVQEQLEVELQLQKEKEREQSKAQMGESIQRFEKTYPTVQEAKAFIEKAVSQSESVNYFV